jgi:hypothetical protein
VPAPEPKLGAPGVVKLHIESPVPVRVVEDAGATVGYAGGQSVVISHMRPVCGGACDRVVDGSQGQSFAATGAFPPATFTLGAYQGDVSLRVQPGSTGRRVGGLWATVLGGTALLTGAVMLPIAVSVSSSTPDSYGLQSSTSGFKTASIGVLVGGAVVTAGGIALLATSGTKVELEPRAGAHGGKVAARQPRYWLGEF